AGSPRRTQDWLLVAGQALPGGIRTRRVPAKGFQGVVVTSYPPFPSLLGAMNVPFCFPILAGEPSFRHQQQSAPHLVPITFSQNVQVMGWPRLTPLLRGHTTQKIPVPLTPPSIFEVLLRVRA